jgi:apolipoprotein N-acyltransferase
MPASEPGEGSLRWWQAIAAGLVHAIFMGLSYPPVGLWPLVFVSPIPLIWAAVGESRRFGREPKLPEDKRRGIGRRVYVGGRRTLRAPLLVSLGVWPLWLYEQQWVIAVSELGYVPMTAGLALFAGFFVWCMARVHAVWPRLPLAVLTAVMWAAIEYVRGQIAFTGYPWFLLAHPLVAIPALAAPAAVLGTYAVSFLAAGMSGGVADVVVLRRRRWVAPAVLAGMWVMLAGIGWSGGVQGVPVRVGIVQTNISSTNKQRWEAEQKVADFRRFIEMSWQAATARPDLIVWPETMFPGFALDRQAVEELREKAIYEPIDTSVLSEGRLYFTEFADALLSVQVELGIPMLVGAQAFDNLNVVIEEGRPLRFPADARYNSAFLVAGGRVVDRYDKLKLTPFGEIMPYIHHWGWLQDRLLDLGARGMRFDLDEGKAAKTLGIVARGQQVQLATPICFEATDNATVRRIRLKAGSQPTIVINLTNDGWFGHFVPGRWHHLQASRWRAVELRTPVLRAANTGVSAVIDARGRLVRAGVDGGEVMVEGILVAETEATTYRTVFAQIGNLFPMLLLVAAAGMLGVAHRRRMAIASSLAS